LPAAQSGRGKKAKEAQMNHTKTLYRGLALALAVTALTGNVVLAEDLPADSTAVAHIVASKATTASPPLSQSLRDAHADAQDAAVQAALQGILADSRTELEMRLAGRKSVILTAGL
jgi:nucleoid-associated protein YgaU